MTSRTQTSSSPFTRLSFIGKGSQSSSPRVREVARRPTADDDYIPYTGSYEEPPRRRQERSRDSWGDPLYEEDGNDMIQDLHQRYVPPDRAQYPWHEEDEERKSRPRARTHSGASGRTVSSGTVDPHRASVSVLRKPSQHANAVRPPVPSYINLDAAGGVGDSPAPPPSRFSREVPPPKRSSLASIFTFGHASKRLPVSPAKVALPTSPPATSPLAISKYARAFATEPQRPASGPPSIYSVSSDKHQSSYASQEGDAYHSYYNYTPATDQFGEMPHPHTATPPPHPYAYVFPHDIPDPPQTAPLVTSPKLKFTQPPHRLAFPQPDASAVPPHVRSLKTYASTPNLHDTSMSPKPRKALIPKGKDRWLSAETWCDAIMFPRPRLKAEDAQLILRGASGRIVSPPGSPVVGDFNAPQRPDRPEGMVSRVLAHSRSLVSLNAEAGTSKLRNEPTFRGTGPITESPRLFVAPPIILPPETERPPRPKSFAWDDLALPSPVPSLARVLEEGQILEHQRKKWQMQAAGSFQNTRARSLSRSRAKSLTQRGGKAGQGQSNMDFLAARSLLGNQDVVPVLPTRAHARTGSQSGTNSNTNGTSSFNTRTSHSHSHSNSLVKTASKSSRGHSRQESWSRSALNKAAALCYTDDIISPVEEKLNELETALQTGGTRVIRLADPALIAVDFGAFSTRNGVSPTPSAVSSAQMGIALGTPPADNSSFERESIHLPSHPYAQGGVSYPYPTAPVVAKGADYAGPHPAAAVVNPNPQDFSARHRLPPQASLTYHPYASPPSRRESYQMVPRADSDVPGPSKMWAQLSPGFVREILPGDLLYSPYMSERSTTPEEQQQRDATAYGQNRKSTATILDTVGLGEALAYAVEEEHSRDSGLGTSEDHAPHAEDWADDGQAAAAEAHHPYRIQRKPVQYDVSRPPYTPKKSGVSSNATNHTVASSPVDPSVSHEHRLTPPTPPLPSNPSPGMNSDASSPPRSPPPVGSVDDLDDFRDLFYKPNLTDEVLNNLSRPTSTRQQSITWDIASTTRTQRTRTGSGLTSLARQLSQEFEEMRAIHHRARTESMGSDSSISRFSGRFPMENDIQFIFSESEMSRAVGEAPVRLGLPEEAMSAFRASGHIPEDVESSRVSSPLDGPLLGDGQEEEDEHEIRVGNVESVATPPATTTNYRASYMGQMLYAEEERAPKDAIPIPRVSSGLQPPPSADPTRSSYMTESTVSRMSNLSDFPAPPPQHMTPAHMSLLSSYFHDAVTERSVPEDESIATFSPRIGERF